MKLKSLRPIIWTDQLEDTISFYTNQLGFTVTEQNSDWGWATLQQHEVEIMITKPIDTIPFDKPIFTGSFYFETEEVDKIWSQLCDKVNICYSIENFPWEMREFAIYDNNGYILQFGQPI